MESFTIGVRCPWWIQALGRSNPLVRCSDRIEALVLVFAVVLSVVALPVAGAVGTYVHEERSLRYIEAAQTRHEVLATATEAGQIVPELRTVSFAAEAVWSEGGLPHRAVVPWSDRAKIGDRQTIWVNNQGDYVGPPASSGQAAGEAVAIALAVWLGVVGVSAAAVHLIRRRLNHWRHAQWDRELNISRDNDGWKKHLS